MTAITILAAITVLTVVLIPAAAELARVRDERNNPIRRLRVPTRRHQALSPSESFA